MQPNTPTAHWSCDALPFCPPPLQPLVMLPTSPSAHCSPPLRSSTGLEDRDPSCHPTRRAMHRDAGCRDAGIGRGHIKFKLDAAEDAVQFRGTVLPAPTLVVNLSRRASVAFCCSLRASFWLRSSSTVSSTLPKRGSRSSVSMRFCRPSFCLRCMSHRMHACVYCKRPREISPPWHHALRSPLDWEYFEQHTGKSFLKVLSTS